MKISEALYEFILGSQAIQYAVFDKRGLLEFACQQFQQSLVRNVEIGMPVEEVFPELLGMEQVIESSLGDGQSMQIDDILCCDSSDEKYISLQILAFQEKTLIVVADTTEKANTHQRLMQQRNELSLLTKELEQTKARLLDISTRFLPSQVFNSLLADKRSPSINGEVRDVTILFADIRGFTRWSEKRNSKEVFNLINRFLEKVIEIVFSHNGTLDKFMGDGFLVIFNAPYDQPDHILHALECAREISRLENEGLRFGIGVHSGQAMTGNIGNAQLMNYTVLGAVVNTAKRLEEFAQPGEVLLSETCAGLPEYTDQVEYLSALQIDKHIEPMPVYRLKC